jgi:hypothetical protein
MRVMALGGFAPAQFWAGPEPAPAPPPDVPRPGAAGRPPAARDTVISLVLSVHAAADRPLGFDRVARLSGSRVTRAQVSAASASLCRDGQLDRIRSSVYQWSAGQRAARQASGVPGTRQADARPPEPPAGRPGRASAAELFGQLFPSGIQMTGELLADLEQWAHLTGKLAARDSVAS